MTSDTAGGSAMEPGIYALSASVYHADPAPEPSYSNSIGHTLMARSPLHAWHAHPKLNPEWQTDEPTSEQEEGTALHALILEQRDVIVPVEAENWRGGDAQKARKAARAEGRVPVLVGRLPELQACAVAVRTQLRQHREALDALSAGKPEQVMLWREEMPAGPIWCRALVDWMPDDPRGFLDDLKTVGGSAEPGQWGKSMIGAGYAMQAMFYLRGARALGRNPAGFRFIVVERDAPHGVSVCSLAPSLEDFAAKQVQQAMESFAECLHGKSWPAYSPHTAWIEAPAWAVMQAEERDLRADFARQGSRANPTPPTEGIFV